MLKHLALTVLIAGTLTACGGDSADSSDTAAETIQIESATADLNTSLEEVEASSADLIEALDSLDVLLPEDDQQ